MVVDTTIIPQQIDVPNSAVVIAENSYRVLKNGTFENGESVVCDVFTDADGKNNTINTGETDLVFDTDKYIIPSVLSGDSEASTVVGKDSTIGTNQTYTVAVNSDGIFNKVMVASIMSSSKTYTIQIKKGSSILASGAASIGAYGTIQHEFAISDYTDIFKAGDTATIIIVMVGNLARKANYAYDGTTFDLASQTSIGAQTGSQAPLTFSTAATAATGKIVMDANTLTLTDVEDSICLWADLTLPSGISATYSVGDGVSTIEGLALDDVINISALSSGTLELTINFVVDGTTENITFYGFSAVVLRS